MPDIEELGVTWKSLAKAACRSAEQSGEWAGAPMIIESAPLVVAPSYIFQGLNGLSIQNLGAEEKILSEKEKALHQVASLLAPKHVNSWWCPRRGGYVHVFRSHTGRAEHYIDNDYACRSSKLLRKAFIAFEAAEVLDVEAELMAQDKLKSLISRHLFDGYLMHGMILETSKRSGVAYVLRKCRPAIALRPDSSGSMRIICCLCLHPIAYYEGSFIGCMVPTDEIIAHLILIRAKEEFFWRKANQHPAWVLEAGL